MVDISAFTPVNPQVEHADLEGFLHPHFNTSKYTPDKYSAK